MSVQMKQIYVIKLAPIHLEAMIVAVCKAILQAELTA